MSNLWLFALALTHDNSWIASTYLFYLYHKITVTWMWNMRVANFEQYYGAVDGSILSLCLITRMELMSSAWKTLGYIMFLIQRMTRLPRKS